VWIPIPSGRGILAGGLVLLSPVSPAHADDIYALFTERPTFVFEVGIGLAGVLAATLLVFNYILSPPYSSNP